MKKIDLGKIRWLAEHTFWIFLASVLLALILGGIIFYKYYILVRGAEPEIQEVPLQFKKDLSQEILAEWANREKRFQEAQTKEYPDPFQP